MVTTYGAEVFVREYLPLEQNGLISYTVTLDMQSNQGSVVFSSAIDKQWLQANFAQVFKASLTSKEDSSEQPKPRESVDFG